MVRKKEINIKQKVLNIVVTIFSTVFSILIMIILNILLLLKKIIHFIWIYLNKNSDSETLLLKKFIIVSILVHLVVYIIIVQDPYIKFPEEWSIETSLEDFDFTTGKDSDQNIEVSDKMLPQLPKNFSIISQNNEDKDSMEDIDSKDKEKQDAKEKEKQKKDNAIAMKDAIKRLAIEKLRKEQQQQKKDKEKQKKDALTRLKDLNLDDLSSAPANDSYKAKLQSHIKKFWTLPDSAEYRDENLEVVISISLNGLGSTMKVGVDKSSGNKVFDEFALSTVSNASPFPPPPKEIQGKKIQLVFSPKSF